MAGMNTTREMSENDAPIERSWIGKNAQSIPVGPKARAVESLTAIRWSVKTRPDAIEEAIYRIILKVSSG